MLTFVILAVVLLLGMIGFVAYTMGGSKTASKAADETSQSQSAGKQ